jgi:hypothetical protein
LAEAIPRAIIFLIAINQGVGFIPNWSGMVVVEKIRNGDGVEISYESCGPYPVPFHRRPQSLIAEILVKEILQDEATENSWIRRYF